MSDIPSATSTPASMAVNTLVDNVFRSLQTIADSLYALCDRCEDAQVRPGSAELSGLRDVVTGELHRHGRLFNGAGVVTADQLLADCPRFLEWWRPSSGSGHHARRLNLDLNPSSEYFYDYTEMEWFAVPRDHGTPCVAGPYLDYTGVDLYVCTFALPVTSARGRFLGIAGADVPVARIEDALLPTFIATRTPLALTNAEGRVIVANHADHVTGSKIRNSAHGLAVPVPHTSWSLVPLRDDA